MFCYFFFRSFNIKRSIGETFQGNPAFDFVKTSQIFNFIHPENDFLQIESNLFSLWKRKIFLLSSARSFDHLLSLPPCHSVFMNCRKFLRFRFVGVSRGRRANGFPAGKKLKSLESFFLMLFRGVRCYKFHCRVVVDVMLGDLLVSTPKRHTFAYRRSTTYYYLIFIKQKIAENISRSCQRQNFTHSLGFLEVSVRFQTFNSFHQLTFMEKYFPSGGLSLQFQSSVGYINMLEFSSTTASSVQVSLIFSGFLLKKCSLHSFENVTKAQSTFLTFSQTFLGIIHYSQVSVLKEDYLRVTDTDRKIQLRQL